MPMKRARDVADLLVAGSEPVVQELQELAEFHRDARCANRCWRAGRGSPCTRAEAGRGGCADPRERVLPEQRRCRARPGWRVAHRPRVLGLRNSRPRGRPSRVGPARCAGFSTHPHWDHLFWHARSARRPVTARPAARTLSEFCCRAWVGRSASSSGYRRTSPSRHRWTCLASLPAWARRDGADSLGWPSSPDYRASSACPGHAALLIEERGVLVAGDMLSDVLIPMLDLNDTADPIEERTLVALRAGSRAWRTTSMSSSPATGPSAELIRYTHGSTRIGRTCTSCVTLMFSATRGSAHWPRTAGTGWPACTHGSSSFSPKEASATGRPASDPLRAPRQTV